MPLTFSLSRHLSAGGVTCRTGCASLSGLERVQTGSCEGLLGAELLECVDAVEAVASLSERRLAVWVTITTGWSGSSSAAARNDVQRDAALSRLVALVWRNWGVWLTATDLPTPSRMSRALASAESREWSVAAL
jgi:hypothetical protein